MKKRLFICLFISFLLLAFSTAAFGVQSVPEPIKVFVDGNEVNFPDIKPLIDNNNRILIPLRFVAEALGAEIEWDNKDRKITITKREKTVELKIGVKKAVVDGIELNFDSSAELAGNRAVVPLRFVAEALGAEVEWNGDTRTIEINSNVKTVESKKIKEFKGQPFKPSDLPTIRGYLYGSDRPGAAVMYATIEDLPIKIGDYIIYDIDIDDKNIKVKQYSELKDPMSFHMVEDNILCRQRDFNEYMDSNIFTYKYPINFDGDNWETDKYIKNPTNLSKVSHFAFDTLVQEGYNNNPVKLLLVENPLYKGRDNK